MGKGPQPDAELGASGSGMAVEMQGCPVALHSTLVNSVCGPAAEPGALVLWCSLAAKALESFPLSHSAHGLGAIQASC